jgi:hemoglobin
MSRAEAVTTRRRALDDPDEIADLVRRFYREVAQDELLGPVFNDVAHVDWAEHLSKLTAFWCRALLGQVGYSGNAFTAHRRINERQPFTIEHFERWLALFEETVDAGWAGVNANRAKQHARFVAQAHQRKLASHSAGDPTRRIQRV